MSAEWFILSNKQPVGPYTLDAVAGLIDEGSIAPNTLVRRLSGPWMPAGQACGRSDTIAPPAAGVFTAMPIAMPIAEPIDEPMEAEETEEEYLARREASRRRRASFLARLATPFAILVGGAAAVGAYIGFNHLFAPIEPAAQEEAEPKPKPKSTRAGRKPAAAQATPQPTATAATGP